jgi:GNAT superfamily N-acetyltransferase
MTRIITLAARDPMPVGVAGEIDVLPEDDRRRHAPDRHVLVLDAGGKLAARASCWWTAAPQLAAQRVGVIGHYAALDAVSGCDALDAACVELRGAGCSVAIGPMDGNTWRRYRFIVERGAEPSFFLEPDNDDAWPDHWLAAGFETLTMYTSALAENPVVDDGRIRDATARLAGHDIVVRDFDMGRAEEELRRIFALSLTGFRENYLYTPIGEAEFLEQNRRLLRAVRPDLVMVAERNGDAVGFLFALPDLNEARRTGTTSTMILKTMAVSPEVSGAGLGRLLVDLVLRRGATLGFRRAIFALMREDNRSQRISRHYARTMRRYALFSRNLTLP